MDYIKIVFVNFLLIITSIYADNPSNCVINNNQINWDIGYFRNVEINDTDIDKIIAEWSFTPPLNISSCDHCDYINVIITNDSTIRFITNQNFANFDIDHNVTNSIFSYSFNINFQCSINNRQSSLTFEQPVRDTNNHPPIFDKNEYNYKIPMPILPNYLITNFGDQIIVEDVDFSNTDIQFEIEPNYNFQISTNQLNNKHYEARITVTQPIRLNQTTRFTLTATDNGEPPQSTIATIIIEVDEEASLPQPPQFTKTNYIFDYAIIDDEPILITNDDIMIETDSPIEDIQISIDTTIELFHIELNRTTKIIQITLNSPLTNLKQHTIVLTLTASLINTSSTTSTTIIINIPDDLLITNPKFNQAIYEFDYKIVDNGTDLVDGDGIQLTNSNETVIIIVEESYQDNFEIVQNSFANSYQIQVINDLDPTILYGGNTEILIEINAILNNTQIDHSILKINLPIIIIEFSQSYYIGNYQINPLLDSLIIGNGPIEITTNNTIIPTVEIIGEYSGNFEINSIGNHIYEIEVIRDLDDSILDEQQNIVVTIQANIDGIITKTVTLFITLPVEENTTSGPQFDSILYTADYRIVDNQHSIVQNDRITIRNDTGNTNVVVIGDFETNFNVTYNEIDNTYQLLIKNNLNQTILNNNHEIIVTLDASIDDNINHDQANVLIKLPEPISDNVPTFSLPYYIGQYIQNNNNVDNDIVTIDNGVIRVINGTPVDTIVTISNDDGYFDINVEDDHWIIVVVHNLPESILQQSTYILQLQLIVANTTITNNGIVVIKLPKQFIESPIEFTKILYIGDYDINTKQLMIDDDIEIIGESLDQIQIKLTGEFSEYFTPTYQQGKITITTTTTTIDDDIVNRNSAITINIEAQLNNVTISSGLVIKFPKINSNLIKFNDVLYTSEYNQNTNSLNMDQKIFVVVNETTTNLDKIVVNLIGVYHTYFTTIYNSTTGEVIINVLTIPQNVIDENSAISLEIIANLDQIQQSVGFVVKLPKTILKSESINFNQALYVAHYNDDGATTTLIIDEQIQINLNNTIGSISDVEITLIGNNSNYFNAINNNGQIQITCTKLPDVILKQTSLITLTIKAVLRDTDDVMGEAGFVIQLPLTNDDDDGSGGDDNSTDDCTNDNQTTYIIVIVILSILLVGGLVGSAVFYYLQRCRNTNYKQMNGDRNMNDNKTDETMATSNRYIKNPSMSEINKFEPTPTRRPTGLTQFPTINQNDVDDSLDDEEPVKRKSVVFDDTVEELQIEAAKNDNDEPTTQL